MRNKAISLALLSFVVAPGCAVDDPAADSFRSASASDEELELAKEVELTDEEAVAVEAALADKEFNKTVPDKALVAAFAAKVKELGTLKPSDSMEEATQLQEELIEIAKELNPELNPEYETYDLDGPWHCNVGAQLLPLVLTYAAASEAAAKASHQIYGAPYSWVTWFMTIVGRIDAEHAASFASQVVFEVPTILHILGDVEAEFRDAETFGWNSHNNVPNGYASGAAQFAGATADLAAETANIVSKCNLL